ncbi:Cyclic pyranopterin monophosphate synthase [Planctomycetes bacterium Poly30]|uniref:Cyclic pyranopterin monophosphate synthase n=1 Tax=Saltatorellus ferox TaxID=2528018 RepID=A0A518EW61_9BACT|nr:Cyclic pyranopterin monophosphate synthase [Planctomycetes bacterium Poly30]
MNSASGTDGGPTLKIRPTLQRTRSPLASPAHQIRVLDALDLVDADFPVRAAGAMGAPLRASGIDVLQLNLGRKCNQTCVHCHVDAGPDRKEDMSREIADLCLAALAKTEIPTVDITGGAPEMSSQFEYLVRGARALGRHVMDRCNLSILLTKPYAHLVDFLAEHQVEVVASLPHYRGQNTDRQRGDGVFDASIEALQRLNAAGYGRDPELRLVLVTNPVGSFLPAGQASLEGEWKREMKRLHGVDFDALYAITNMPISRYLEWLEAGGRTEAYLQKLVDAFNPASVPGVMCRGTLSVGWDGRLFDCDFNQMLDLEVDARAPRHIQDFALESLGDREIVVGRHCFGCTAGAGSSCGGATT